MNEHDRYKTKFFDYRPLTPDQATMLFMLEWAKAFQSHNQYMGRSKFFDFLKKYERFDLEYLRKARQFKTIGKIRQFADEHFLKYDLFWSWAFEALIELKFKRDFLNVFLNENMKAKILEKQAEHRKHFPVFSNMWWTKAEFYEGREIQDDYLEYILKEFKRLYSEDRQKGMVRQFIQDGFIPLEFLKKAGRSENGNRRSV